MIKEQVSKNVKINGRFIQSVKFAAGLLKQAFIQTDFEIEKQSLEEKLITKSWVCHCCLTLARIVAIAFGNAYWQEVYKSDDDDYPEDTDKEFVRDTKGPV